MNLVILFRSELTMCGGRLVIHQEIPDYWSWMSENVVRDLSPLLDSSYKVNFHEGECIKAESPLSCLCSWNTDTLGALAEKLENCGENYFTVRLKVAASNTGMTFDTTPSL